MNDTIANSPGSSQGTNSNLWLEVKQSLQRKPKTLKSLHKELRPHSSFNNFAIKVSAWKEAGLLDIEGYVYSVVEDDNWIKKLPHELRTADAFQDYMNKRMKKDPEEMRKWGEYRHNNQQKMMEAVYKQMVDDKLIPDVIKDALPDGD